MLPAAVECRPAANPDGEAEPIGLLPRTRPEIEIAYKLATDGPMTDGPQAAVRIWFRSHGYPLEYHAARVFAEAGMQVRQGLAYQDSDEPSKTREVDVIADLPDTTDHFIRVVLECKRAANPWVVFVPDRNQSGSTRFEDSAILTRAMANSVEGIRLAGPPFPRIFSLPEPIGFSVREANPKRKENQPDPAVAALHQVTKAAVGSFDEYGFGGGHFMAVLSHPAIVIDGPLFRISVTATDEDEIERVLWHTVLWHGTTTKVGPARVDIVTRDFLPTYAASIAKDLIEFYKAIPRTTPQ